MLCVGKSEACVLDENFVHRKLLGQFEFCFNRIEISLLFKSLKDSNFDSFDKKIRKML